MFDAGVAGGSMLWVLWRARKVVACNFKNGRLFVLGRRWCEWEVGDDSLVCKCQVLSRTGYKSNMRRRMCLWAENDSGGDDR